MAKQHAIWSPLFLAYYSKALYKDVGKIWKGVGFLYVLLLAAIYAIFLTYHAQVVFRTSVQGIHPLIAELPAMTFKDGKVSIDQPSPYSIMEPGTQRVLAIIDTSGKINSLQNLPALFLLTQDQLFVKNSPEVTKIYSLTGIANGTYTGQSINYFLDQAVTYGPLALYPLSFCLAVLEMLVVIFIFAALALLFIHSQLQYSGLCRITAVALTPTVLLVIVLNLLNVRLPYQPLIYFLLTWVYIFYGIEMCISPSKQADIEQS